MSISSWQSIIETIRNGEPVTAEIANRAIDQLTQRTQHLKERQDAQSLASAIFISGAPLTDDVKTGNAVYFNSVAGKFAPAYAELVYQAGYLSMSETATVAGIVVYKDTTDSGVIVVDGLVDPTLYAGIDCTGENITANLLVNTDEKGLLYLANGASNAGKVIAKPGLLNVPVCSLIDSKHLLVRPPLSSPLETQALRFQLTARPATPELVLQKAIAGVAADFSSNPGAATDLAAGKSVRVYTCNYGSSNTEGTLYFTGTVHKYSSTGEIQLKNVTVSKDAISAISANADYGALLMAGAGLAIAIKPVGGATGYTMNAGANSSTASTLTSYVSVISTSSPSTGYVIKSEYIDATLPGWLPASTAYFPNTVIPSSAKYGYNFAADPLLQQLFPETVVGAYILYKDGTALPSSTATTGSNGIWWMDSFNQTPWHKVGSGTGAKHVLPDPAVVFGDWNLNTSSQIVQPTELILAYTKLVSGGINVVTTLETTDGSPITITDPYGNPANSGPLVIKAGFTVADSSTTEPGSLVVKDVTGFNMKRGRVVERILAGTNISISSAIGSGQGEVQVNVVGLDGKLEGAPDILAIDDVLVEKDTSLNVFYSAMPPGKNSSILGKVDIPNYLDGTYKLNLVMTFVALHNAGNLNMPSLALSWVNMQAPTEGTKYNLSSSNTATGELSGGLSPYTGTVAPRDYFVKTVELATAYAGGEIFFRLARSSSDSYVGKLGIISLRYKFIKAL